jgi:hypothetical protein
MNAQRDAMHMRDHRRDRLDWWDWILQGNSMELRARVAKRAS